MSHFDPSMRFIDRNVNKMDIKELEVLIQRIRPRMLQMAQKMLPDEDAEDAVQDSLCRVWMKREEMCLHINPEAAILCLHRNMVISRTRKRKEETIDIDSLLLPDEEDTSDERIEMMVNKMQRLPSKQMMILRMKYLEGVGNDEIMRITGMKADAVRKNLSRATRALRGMIAVGVVFLFGCGLSIHLYNRHQEYERLRASYEGSYAIINGERIDDLRELKPDIERTLSEANSLTQQASTARLDLSSELSQGITDPEILEIIQQSCE